MPYMSQNMAIFISTNTTVQSTVTAIGEVTEFTGPGGQAAVIDVTHLGSTAKEKLIGLRDEGQLSLTMNAVVTDAGQSALIVDRINRTKRKFVVKFSDTAAGESSHIAVFEGYVMQYSIAGGVDAALKANAVIEITGGVTYTTA